MDSSEIAAAASILNTMTYEPGYLEDSDFPRAEEPVWILGKEYTAKERDEIHADIRSLLWFTYRRGFQAIGGVGPMSDVGWGCMLRCGQMMMARALSMCYLGRDWKWKPNTRDPKYLDILQRFLDKKNSCYSIHQIASMGVTEGKEVGEWFGPNTAAQVFRKLASYDERGGIAVHVALDNTVVMEDIETLCRLPNPRARKVSSSRGQGHHRAAQQRSAGENDSYVSASLYPDLSALTDSSDASSAGSYENGLHAASDPSVLEGCTEEEMNEPNWRHLLLIIPLRLGLSEMNLVYADALRACLRLPQSVGIIGGEPNHAHWFIGYFEDELIFLDPHTLQPVADVTASSEESDETYHYRGRANRIRFQGLDPSIAVGFYFHTEQDFHDFCRQAKKLFGNDTFTAMFELCQKRPSHWPPFQPYVPDVSGVNEFTLLDRKYDSEEEFELL